MSPDALTVSVLPSFAVKWLVPRMSQFQQLHPGIDLRITAADRLVDFVRDSVDVAVRFGAGNRGRGFVPTSSSTNTSCRFARRRWRRGCATRPTSRT